MNQEAANDKAKPNVEKGLEKVAAEQDRFPEGEAGTKTEVGTSSQRPPNQTVQFPKTGHPLSPDSGQKKTLRTTAPGTAPTPRLFSLGLTPS
jgi:hypothetical protein